MREIILLGQVAQMLGINHETCRRWAVEGRIPTFRYNGRGQWRAFKDDIDKFLEARQAKATTGQVESASQ